MATKKWLSIVVDGNSALTPSWPKIVSEYLAKIVRAFFDNSRRQVVIPSCELGLIMYNANNSDLGYNVQFIKWTTDVDHFLGTLSRLTFNGNNENQHTIVQGLAEALVMFTRNMSVKEYFKGERHCILVATGDPVPQKMLVTLPTVEEGKFVVENFKILNAHFLEVAKMFKSLEVSLSVITPKQHPMFRSIFNVGML
ncbi:mediator of RNA polymerase II transcription subunit 25-like [Cajanus cajan]|uniref:mediator of RNA polymerase II transcription subunit 25-like n=1 Tax=Cajanus cajan TaxID=3821 RepID=UPI00098DBF3F|nr:mediator of RNA polymerase II transcription subunit 25-like [Cajanus cajan]